jgi:hypothetical protein
LTTQKYKKDVNFERKTEISKEGFFGRRILPQQISPSC